MDKRRIAILKAVVNDYIETGNAISSSRLTQDHHFAVSSATIRGELAQLEIEGYLTHPHTSSGRIPTDKGYRFYVDHFIKSRALPDQERSKIVGTYRELLSDIDLILQETVSVLTELTDCFCLASLPDVRSNIIKMIKFILLNVQQVLVVILMNSGISKDFVINFEQGIDEDALDKVADLFRQTIQERPFTEVESIDVHELVQEIPLYKGMIEKVHGVIKKAGKYLNEKPGIYKKGTSKLMLYNHDFTSIEELREVIEILEQERSLAEFILQKQSASETVSFTIGSENTEQRLRSCTIGQVSYTVGGGRGEVVVVGPKRLKYMNVSSILKTVADALSTAINGQ